MGFNEEELLRIKKATSGWFKKSARTFVAQVLLTMKTRIDAAKKLDDTERLETFIFLLLEATAARRVAVQSGANSYSQPQWAAAAACENWLFELVQGTTKTVNRVELLITDLSNR